MLRCLMFYFINQQLQNRSHPGRHLSPDQIITITSITFSGSNIPLSSAVTNVGVKMDPQLTFESHINHLCKTSYHLCNISKLRPILSFSDAKKLVHAFISSRLDYWNALLIRIPSKSLQRLQYIQNSAARILMSAQTWAHYTHPPLTPLAFRLHQDWVQGFPPHTPMYPWTCPPPTSKNFLTHKTQHATSAPLTQTSSTYPEPDMGPWEIGLSVLLPHAWGCWLILSLVLFFVLSRPKKLILSTM